MAVAMCVQEQGLVTMSPLVSPLLEGAIILGNVVLRQKNRPLVVMAPQLVVT